MKVYQLKDEDFANLARRVELHYRKRATDARQPWETSFMAEDPRGISIYDQFKGTWLELLRWCDEHEINLFKAMHP